MKNLRDSAALITGGSSGIGLGLACALAEHGVRVGIVGTNPEKLTRAEHYLRSQGATVCSAVLDVADQSAWPAAVAKIESSIGAVDTVALNAGIGTGGMPVTDAPLSSWRWTWDVNLLGVVHGIQACVPAMRERGTAGRILITASIAAVIQPPGLGPYTASKAAVLALAQTLRAELADTALQVSIMLPATVRTDFGATSQQHAPSDWGRTETSAQIFSTIKDHLDAGLDPTEVGRYTVQRLLEGAFYIFTHADFREEIRAAQKELLDAIPTTNLSR